MTLTLDERALHLVAKERILKGELPREVGPSIWAGRGTGSVCILCNKTVDSQQIEYEIQEPGGRSFRFHLRCHAIWQLALSDGD